MWPFLGRGKTEGEVNDPRYSAAAVDHLLNPELVWRPTVEATSNVAVLSFDILADDDGSIGSASAFLNGLCNPSNTRIGRRFTYLWKPRRIGIKKAPERHGVRDAGSTDRAEEDGVERLQLCKPVRGHHRALARVAVT